ncbi:glycosyltransferase family 4 protein [Luteimonas marina]|uniref:Glycosyltransferase family 4 protein n=1 Tax=Luteimonas marina TaxID=488485 RepID=A0A5C5TWU5_9GAMM|nr:glycosyltransferase family 4 protein [Luteimonas marina]TWT18631.1 glycosyltransferase family 4 protein [Luteimonas marina]
MSGRRMLFHRDFLGYTGGHGKVWDYFNHALALGWDARVYLTPGSLRGSTNPWSALPGRIEATWRPSQADVLFLGGMDWLALDDTVPAASTHVINLVQHVRHADPASPLRAFLGRNAWRICVGRAVADAIVSTGDVVGPVRVIPAGLDLTVSRQAGEQEGAGVFIGALKNPGLGLALAGMLSDAGCSVRLEAGWMPRDAFLAAMAEAETVVALPHPTEGFFLPGLEALALGRSLVMPPCGGSGEYARDGWNCLMPPPDPDALAAAVLRLRDRPLRARLRQNGFETVARHSLAAERAAFAGLLDEVVA